MDGFMMLSDPQGLRVLTYILLSLLPFVFFYLTGNPKASKLPTINNKRLFEFSDRRLKQDFARNARQLLRQGLEKYGGKPFKILTDHGTTIILPPEYTQEIRNSPHLNHVQAIAKVRFSPLTLASFPTYETNNRLSSSMPDTLESRRSMNSLSAVASFRTLSIPS